MIKVPRNKQKIGKIYRHLKTIELSACKILTPTFCFIEVKQRKITFFISEKNLCEETLENSDLRFHFRLCETDYKKRSS